MKPTILAILAIFALPLAFATLSIAFAAHAAEFPALYNSEPDKSSPMPAQEAAEKMKVPPGFRVSVFASEPDVQNPIAMNWDARGRLWIAENYTYAESAKKFDLNLRDRILIFEDKKGDGHFSSRKVFTDDIQMLTSIEVGQGGVWAMCPPNLVFIPDKDGRDVPDGPPQVVLDGFMVPKGNYHNFANGLRFGPDGWLYGRCGHSAPGEVGPPDAIPEQRVPLRGTMWRYHPKLKIFEALSAGTTNPWGHDWDENGELFFINTVNGHLWHQITGAHYENTGGHSHTYGLIEQHADHWHFDTSQHWGKSKSGAAKAYGGGHAHIGMMIYQGDNWPAEYRGNLFTFNMHGLCANQELLEREGSGYVGRHGQDMLFAADPWFRGIDLGYGPDGGVFALDWSDAGECHDHTGVHRTSGRIFKITHGEVKNVPGDLTKLNVTDLVKLHTHASEWFVRQARRQLADRAVTGADLKDAIAQLHKMYDEQADGVMKLRALWSLQVIGALDEPFLILQLKSDNEHIRVWAVRLLTDLWPLDTFHSKRPTGRNEAATAKLLPRFATMARDDKSGLVRLALSTILQRLPISDRPALAAELVAHSEDAQDHNLPYMLWYGLIPVGDQTPAALPKLAIACELPLTRKFITRRLAENIEKNPAPLNDLLTLASTSKSAALHDDILTGLTEGLKGWRKTTKPTAWDGFAKALAGSNDPALSKRAGSLSVFFGDARALEEVKKQALDGSLSAEARQTALQIVIDNNPPDLRSLCESLLKTPAVNAVAARGLATLNDPAIAKKLVEAYPDFTTADRSQLIAALVSRATFIPPLLDAVEAGRIPRTDITAFHARQIRGFNDAKVTARLTAVWGGLRDFTPDKQKHIAELKARLTPALLAKADKKQGQVIYTGLCATCHTLNGTGGKIGPDLTGSGRDNLDYLLMNIVDPSAAIAADYSMVIANLKDGRILPGTLAAETDRTVTVRMLTETTTVERAAINTLEESPISMMPEGMLDALPEPALRDLIAYLMDKGAK
jgi:putative membrane-bound dehydrogenase-like protein